MLPEKSARPRPSHPDDAQKCWQQGPKSTVSTSVPGLARVWPQVLEAPAPGGDMVGVRELGPRWHPTGRTETSRERRGGPMSDYNSKVKN